MPYSFSCFGHENLLGTHKNTLEFTKDSHLTKNGDCIIGIKATFSLEKLKQFIKDKDKIHATISCKDLKDSFTFDINKNFSSDHEIVIRIGRFESERTLGLFSDKASYHIDRKIIEIMKLPNSELLVTFND